jgi:hypothetical protein
MITIGWKNDWIRNGSWRIFSFPSNNQSISTGRIDLPQEISSAKRRLDWNTLSSARGQRRWINSEQQLVPLQPVLGVPQQPGLAAQQQPVRFGPVYSNIRQKARNKRIKQHFKKAGMEEDHFVVSSGKGRFRFGQFIDNVIQTHEISTIQTKQSGIGRSDRKDCQLY